MKNPFRYLNSSPEVIRLTVMTYVRYPLSLRRVEDLLFERGIEYGIALEPWPGLVDGFARIGVRPATGRG